MTLIMMLTLSCFTGCGKSEPSAKAMPPDLKGLYDAIDVDFAAEVTTAIADCGTHPELGYRLSGSAGEQAAADYLYQTFKEVGLQNITRHPTTVDTWSMTKSNLFYTDKDGKEQKILLGSYQTTFLSDHQEYELLYLGEGTIDDYENIDATGKIVLIDIDQSENWWANWPAFQAKVKGASCVIVANNGGYGQLDDDTLLSQDICGPADAPALSITNTDANILKDLIGKSESNSIKIKIDCDAKVTNDGKSQNISGIIPGKTNEVIFLMGHYDGYYHAWHDDASGVGMALTIAKAILDSGYTPEKTIILTTHGAEEWGTENSRYDWAIGAYEQIMNITPEWADRGFAVINCESGCAREDDTHFALGTSYELKTTLEDIVYPLNNLSPWDEDNKIYSPATVWSEDFPYSLAGVPGMVTKKTSGEFNLNSYHSNKDIKEDHFSKEHYQYSHQVYCSILYALDTTAVQPLNFTTRLDALSESISDTCPNKEDLAKSISIATESSNALKEKIDQANENDTISEKEASALNVNLRDAFKFAQNNITAFDWEDNVVFPHECSQSNIENLEEAIAALETGDITTALDEYIYAIDYNWYASAFDYETYTFFVDQTLKASPEKLAWGKGMIKQGNEDLFKVIASLKEKSESPNPNVTEEIFLLKASLENQKKIGKNIVLQEIKDIETLTEKMNALL